VITDSAGKAIWQWDADPFGVTLANADPDGDGVKFVYNLRFSGQYFDSETRLHYNYFRDYNPKTGRYIESDPIGLQGGLNTYGYVGGNPLNKIDSLGLAGMFVYFSDYQVDTGMGFSLPLGHAGVVAIDNNTGATQYFDFGRYGGKYGDVRGPFDVGKITFDERGFPTKDSLDIVQENMSQEYGKDNFANVLYNKDADVQKIIDFALDRQRNVDKYPYTLNPFSKNKLNFCDTFAWDALKAGLK
jgi:RHS repeat-associated protein